MKINLDSLKRATTHGGAPAGVPEGYVTTTDGENVTIDTPPLLGSITDYDQMISEAGYDPEQFELAGTPTVKTWDAQTPDGVQRLRSFKLTLTRRVDDTVSVDELVNIINQAKQPTVTVNSDTTRPVGVFAIGDLQLGKQDGGGSKLIIERVLASIEAGVRKWQAAPTGHVIVAFLGDCIEGVVSQGGRNIANNDLSLTEQLRVLRHLMTRTITWFLGAGAKLTVLSVPGNHDETYRSPVQASPGDSFAVDALRTVEEAFTLAGRDKNLAFLYPDGTDLHVSTTVGGIGFLFAHGHQWRTGKHFDWWKGHLFNGGDYANTDFLLAGHRHHLCVDTESERYFIQVPAMENRSDWWVNKTGQIGNPSALWVVPNGKKGIHEIATI